MLARRAEDMEKRLRGAVIPKQQIMRRIGVAKDDALARRGKLLLDGCPREYRDAYDHTQTLAYADEPNYELIKRSWLACMTKNMFKPDTPLDWEPKGEHFKEAMAVPHATMMVVDKDREDMLKKSFEDEQKK